MLNQNELSTLALVASDASYRPAEEIGSIPFLPLFSYQDSRPEEEFGFPRSLVSSIENVPSSPMAYDFDTDPVTGTSSILFTNWEFVTKFQDENSGFGAAIYRSKQPIDGKPHYIVALQGSDGANAQDWFQNLDRAQEVWAAQGPGLTDFLVNGDPEILSGIVPGDGVIHFTGQSLGGGLAQYAAYSYVSARVDLGFTKSQQVTLTTFNGFGAVGGIASIAGSNFAANLLSGVPTYHYAIENDLVHRLGAGSAIAPGGSWHLNGLGNSYVFDFRRVVGGIEVVGKQNYLNLVDAHRIESGFYQSFANYSVDFQSIFGLFIDGRPIASPRRFSYIDTQTAQGIGARIAHAFTRGGVVTESGARARIVAGVLVATGTGPIQEVSGIASELAESLYRSGDINDVGKGLVKTAPFGMKAVFAGLLKAGLGGPAALLITFGTSFWKLLSPSEQRDVIIEVNRQLPDAEKVAQIQFAVPGDTQADGALRYRLALYQAARYISESDEQLAYPDQTAREIANLIQEIVPDSGVYFDKLIDGSKWLQRTLAFLQQRAFAAGIRDQALVDFNLKLTSLVWKEIEELGTQDATFIARARDSLREFLRTDFAKSLANANEKFASKYALDGANPFGSSLTFEQYGRYQKRLSDAALDPAYANIRSLVEAAIPIVNGSGERLWLLPGAQTPPFDVVGSAPEPSGTPEAGTIVEAGAQTYTAYVPYVAGPGGLRTRYQLAGSGNSTFAIVTGASTAQLDGSGTFEIVIPEGQRQASFVLVQNKDVPSNSALTLTATLLGANGMPSHQAQAVAVLNLVAHDEGADTPTTTYTILGDQLPPPPGTTDPWGNTVGGAPAPGRNDFLNGSPANDRIEGLGGGDIINGGDGDDWVLGGDGIDWMAGLAGDDRVEGGAGEDFAIGGAGKDLMLGGDGGDSLLGTEGDDRIYAAVQADDGTVFDSDTVTVTPEEHWLDGGEGRDRLIGGTGADVVLGGAGEDMLAGGAGADTLYGDRDTRIDPFPIPPGTPVTLTTDEINAAGGADFLHGGGGDDALYGEVGADTLLGAGGNDTLVGDADDLAEALHGGDFLDGGEGNDQLFGQGGNDALYGGAGNDVLQGDDLAHAPGDDYLSGEDGDDELIGAGGRDVLYGGAGNDQLFGDSEDTPLARQMADELFGGEGEDFLQGYGGDDYLDGGAGADTVLGGLGQDRILGGAGNDVLVGDEGDSNPDGGDADVIDGGEGDDTLFGQGGNDQLFGGAGVDQLQGGVGNDYLDGGAGNDTLVGEAGNDVLQGGEGEDTLAGGDGEDTLRGGAGNDLIAGDNGGSDPSGAADIIEGGAGNDQIAGQGGDDRLDGGDGDDLLQGNTGNDVLAGGQGVDELQGNEGNDQIDGGDGDDLLFGGIGSDLLNGGFGDDFLQGDAGSDTLAGGGGHDLYGYALGDGIDTIVDAGGNTLQLGFNYFPGMVSLRIGSLTLDFGGGSEIHIEGFDPEDPFGTSSITEFQFAGGTVLTLDELLALGFDLDGTPEADVLEGTVLDDRIDAYESDDVVLGKAGNDTIDAGSGDDVVEAGEGDDRLDGGAGADLLTGGAGDDKYVISDELDTIVEGVDEGYDTIESSITYTLPENVEELALTGTDDISGTGNDSDNDLEGNAGNNQLHGLGGDDSLAGREGDDLLDGGEGTDVMSGYVGDDTYVVDNEDDVVDEQLDFYDYEIIEDPDTGEISYATLDSSGGLDTVHSSVSFALDSWTENLTLTGTDAIDGVGNVESNVMIGNEADNALYAYRVNGVADTYPSIGVFVQQFSLARNSAEEMLADKANVEIYRGRFPWFVPQQVDLFAGEGDILIGGGGDDRLYGHLDDDWLEGGEGDDLLYGFTGADTLIGGAGDDTYVVSGAYDLIFSYQGGEYVSYFDKSQDELIEQEDEGIDTVYSEVSFELPENFENLTLVFTTTAFDPDGQISVRFGREFAEEGIGNDLDNELRTIGVSAYLGGEGGRDRLFGGDGNDELDGGEDADFMAGGAGDDFYYVQDAGDEVVELAGQGIDEVSSEISYTLTANVENLYVTGDEGDEDLDGTGNELDNLIEGNEGANVLAGLDGNDALYGWGGEDTLLGGAGHDDLDGGLGADSMSGGDGDDIYWVDDELDVTTEASAAGGRDLVYSSVTHALGENIEDLDLLDFDADEFFVGAIDGFGNELDNRIIGNESGNALEGFGGNDTLRGRSGADSLFGGEGEDWLDGGEGGDYFEGGAGNDTYLVDGWDHAIVEMENEGVDLAISADSHELAENVENLTFLGDFALEGFDVDNLDGKGNGLDNVILGNDGWNFLDGLGGDDDMDGRAGSDWIEGDDGNDVLYGGDDAIVASGFEQEEEHFAAGFGGEDEPPAKRPSSGGETFLAPNADEIYGGAGADVIDGGSGNDNLFGDEGDDTLFGGEDGLIADRVDSGTGEGGDYGETGDGRVFHSNDDALEGGDGDDVLDGGSGDDALLGGAGDDVLIGGADGPLNTSNNDYLNGGAGIDTMSGGTGDDEYVLDGTFFETTGIPVYDDCGDLVEGAVTRVWTTDTVIEHAGEGYDRIFASAEITLPDHVEELQLVNIANVLIGRGNAGDNVLFGNSGHNRLEGGAGNDRLFGQFGNDVLEGGAGDDELFGEAGNDIYNLGPGSGHDTVFNSGGGVDAAHITQQLTPGELTFSTNGEDVTIGIDGSRDRMVLEDWFNSSTRVQQVVFCDGTILDAAAIATLANGLVLIAGDDAATAVEDGAAVTGNVLVNDFDSDPTAVLTVYNPGTYAGAYGTLAIAGNGDFSFTAGDGAQWLAEGEAAREGFVYRAQDALNANDEAVLEVTVIGTNDAPVFDAGGTGELTEDAPQQELGDELLENGDFESSFFDWWNIEGGFEYVGQIESTLEGEAGYFGAIGEATLLGQEVGTWSDESYLVSFWLKGGGVGGVTFSASWNGIELVSLADDVLPDYTEFSFVVDGADAFSALGFALRNDPDFWYLDEVSVRELDEFVPDEASVSGSLLFTDIDLSDTHQIINIEALGDDFVGSFDAGIEWDSTFAEYGSVAWNFAVVNDDIDFLAEGQSLVQTYAVTIGDPFGATDTETVAVTIHGANDAPYAEDDEAFVTEDLAPVASGNVLDNDDDPDDGAVLAVTTVGTLAGEFGTLELAADGSYTYTLDNEAAQSMQEGEEFVETFEYEMTDGLADAAQGALYVTIGGINDAPVAMIDMAGVHEDVVLAVSGNVLANDSDADDGDDLAVIDTPAVYAGAFGTLTLEEDGSFSYALDNASAAVQALAAGQTVIDSFAYGANDGFEVTPGLLEIAVSGINDAPLALDDTAAAIEDIASSATGNVLGNDSDIDFGTLLGVATPGSLTGAYGTLTLAANGDYSYVLSDGSEVQALRQGETVFDAFTYAATDGILLAAAELVVSIDGINDAPVTGADAAGVQEDGMLEAAGNVLANDSDIDQQAVLTVANAGLYGSLSLEVGGGFVYALDNASAGVQSLAAGQTVFEAFAYLASDGIEDTPGTLTIAVAGTNDAPLVANPIADQSADAGSAFGFTFAADAFADVDQGDALAYGATLVDGQPLPEWLSFDAATRTFTGTPPGGVGCDCDCDGTEAEELQIRVQATDLAGASAFDDFRLGIAGGEGGSGQVIIGTDGNDVLAGTPCDDIIDGRKGFDVMTGGAGDDVYYVDETCPPDGHHGNEGVGNGEDPPPPGHDHNHNDGPGTSPGHPGSKGGHHDDDRDDCSDDCRVDQVVEAAGDGYDTVYASADYTLAANVEGLWLLGDENLGGTGNSLDNVLAGNGGDNRLAGGLGSDLYLYELQGGKDTIVEKGGQDVLRFGEGITQEMVRAKRSRDDLVLDLPGSHDSVTIKGWFDSSAGRVEAIQFADGSSWGEDEIRERARRGDGVCEPIDHGDGDDRHRGHHDHGGRGNDRADRHDPAPRQDDDWHGGRHGKPAHFDFEDFHRNARGWSRAQSYANRLATEDQDDPRHGAPTRSGKSWSLLGAALGGGMGWGYDGSVGASRGPEDLKSLEGLMEGFQRL